MRILITGGAGYIGSHAVRALLDQGHEAWVVDDLSTGHRKAIDSRAEFVEANSGDRARMTRLLKDQRIEAVLHFAANIEVGESVTNPGKYYENNFSASLRLLGAMVDANVSKIVFSSTAAIYGQPEKCPISESQARAPINPYGRSKMMTELAIEDFSKAHGMSHAILRYFNVAGAASDGAIGEDHFPESHLIPRILAAARDPEQNEIAIYGTDYPTPDGTCVRDYVHVMDLVDAHLLALEKMRPGEGAVYNLGSENGFSVREVISTCEKVTRRSLRVREHARRAGDSPTLVASSEKIRRELGWKPRYPDLETIVAHAWKWHSTHPQGYR